MRLLVVDDDISVRMLLSMALHDDDIVEGWRAGNVVDLAAGEHVDAVILDRGLPDGDGLAAVRALRNNASTADLPVLVITADDDPAQRSAAFGAGADEHAVKPLDPDTVLAVVQQLAATPMRERRLRRTVRRARLHVGRLDGGWDDLVPEVVEIEPARKRRWLGRAS